MNRYLYIIEYLQVPFKTRIEVENTQREKCNLIFIIKKDNLNDWDQQVMIERYLYITHK